MEDNNSLVFKDIKKILVIKLRHIGDVLLTVPTIRALKETFPDASISVLVNSGTEEVLAGSNCIDELIIFDRSLKSLPAVKRLAKEIDFLKRIRIEKFDITVDLTSGDRAAIISFVSGARYRIARDPCGAGFLGKKYIYTHLAEATFHRHIVLQSLDIIGQFGINTGNRDVDFFIPDEIRFSIKNLLKKNGVKMNDKIVHIHPVSRWFFKCWKDEYMAEVILWLIKEGKKVVVTSAPDRKEMEKAKNILSLCFSQISIRPTQLLDLCGRTTIKELAALSEASSLFIGVDSAPMHIAASVRTPVIALFGPTGEEWMPYSQCCMVISKDMPCKPCKKGMCEGIQLRECMSAIKPEDVKKAVSNMLNVQLNTHT